MHRLHTPVLCACVTVGMCIPPCPGLLVFRRIGHSTLSVLIEVMVHIVYFHVAGL